MCTKTTLSNGLKCLSYLFGKGSSAGREVSPHLGLFKCVRFFIRLLFLNNIGRFICEIVSANIFHLAVLHVILFCDALYKSEPVHAKLTVEATSNFTGLENKSGDWCEWVKCVFSLKYWIINGPSWHLLNILNRLSKATTELFLNSNPSAYDWFFEFRKQKTNLPKKTASSQN